MSDWKNRRSHRNLALAAALVGLVVIIYAISFIKTRDVENRRHLKDPQAHAIVPSNPAP